MPIRTVAIMTTGEMGQAVGRVLGAAGLRVITCPQGRSERTISLARQAGIEDVADLATLVREADALLAILAPAHALSMATAIVEAIGLEGTKLLYADCNAIAPATTRRIGHLV